MKRYPVLFHKWLKQQRKEHFLITSSAAQENSVYESVVDNPMQHADTARTVRFARIFSRASFGVHFHHGNVIKQLVHAISSAKSRFGALGKFR